MIVSEITIESWIHLTELVAAFDIGNPASAPYLFRGQADATWQLRPSLSRHISGLAPRAALQIEEDITELFRSQAHLHLSSTTIAATTDLASWWTLMQHYGAPTRLLDWTASPFVAAYFAVVQEPDKPGVIWIVQWPNEATASCSVVARTGSTSRMRGSGITHGWGGGFSRRRPVIWPR